MSNNAFSPDWLQQYTDPYAVLGVSVAADDRRILKRYRQLAKQLHPDLQLNATTDQQQFVDQVLPKLVNPAYQRLKQDKSRNEVLATLRFKVRRLSREKQLDPINEKARQLLTVPETEVDLFYEQTVDQLCEQQYDSLATFVAITQQLGELNLVLLRRKMGEPVIREKRTGLMTASVATSSPIPSPGQNSGEKPSINYADRHFQRARAYLQSQNAQGAIQELKDAIKLDPKNSNYHCLIGQAYLLSKLPGMAKVHFKQALKLNPQNSVAQKYSRQLCLDTPQPLDANSQNAAPAPSSTSPKRGLFGGMFSNR